MLFRIPAVFTAPADVLAGVALARAAGFEFSLAQVIFLIFASASIYAAGMAANDICDVKVDAVERPSRPLPSGQIKLSVAWAWVIGLQALGLLFGALAGYKAAFAVLITVLLTWIYNAWAKNYHVGPIFMGLCRYSNAFIGWSLVGLSFLTGWLIPLFTLLFVIALTSLSRFEVGDRVARAPLVAMGLTATLAVSLPLSPWLAQPWGALMFIPMSALLFPALKRAWGAPEHIKGAVKRGIFTIPLINAALALGAGGLYEASAILGMLAVGFFFGRWFYAT